MNKRDEIIAAIKKCAERLGRAPSQAEFRRASKISWYQVYKHFRGMRQAVRAAGLVPGPRGSALDINALTLDWAGVVRKLGRLPSRAEYCEHGCPGGAARCPRRCGRLGLRPAPPGHRGEPPRVRPARRHPGRSRPVGPQACAAAAARGTPVTAGRVPAAAGAPPARKVGDPAARAAERTLVVGLTIFAAVLAAGGLLVVGQGLLRHHAAHRACAGGGAGAGADPGERVGGPPRRVQRPPPSSPPCSRGAIGGDGRGARCSRWAARPVRAGAGVPGAVGGEGSAGRWVTALAFLALGGGGRRDRRTARPRPRAAHRPRGLGLDRRWGPRRSSGCGVACGGHGRRGGGVSQGRRCGGGASSRRSRSARASRCSCPIRCAPGQVADLGAEDAEEVDVAGSRSVTPAWRWRWSVTRSVVARARRRRRAAGPGRGDARRRS